MTPTHSNHWRAWAHSVVILWAVGIAAAPCVASSVLQFSFDELCDHSESIIEGRVVRVQSRFDEPGGQISTYVRIAVLDRLKGPTVGSELELHFAGGTVDGLSLEIADMRLPAVGEVGIYFVESVRRRQVHPLVGWSQGHFLELNDRKTGHRGVFTPGGKAVLGIGKAVSGAQRRQVLSGTGAALEVQVEGIAGALRPALAVAEFKARIRRDVAALATVPAAKP